MLNNTFQPSSAILMFLFEVRENCTMVLNTDTTRVKNTQFVTIFIKSNWFIVFPLLLLKWLPFTLFYPFQAVVNSPGPSMPPGV